MQPVDQTNKNATGKMMIEIQKLAHFNFKNNLLVRITCNPFVVETRRILDDIPDFQ